MGYFFMVTDKDGEVKRDATGSELRGGTTNLSTVARTIADMGLKDGQYSVFKNVTAEAKEWVEGFRKEK